MNILQGLYYLVSFYHLDEKLNVKSSGNLAKDGDPIVSRYSEIEVTPQGPEASVPESWGVYIDCNERCKYASTIDNKFEVSLSFPAYTWWVRLAEQPEAELVQPTPSART